MEDILSSIKRIIAEEAEPAANTRVRRSLRQTSAPADQDDVLELKDPAPASAPAAQPREPVVAPAREPILSSTAAEASRLSLESLSRLVVKPETPGSDTLEGLVREMLRPMLRDWLDTHLPEMVEAMVAREIARIASQV